MVAGWYTATTVAGWDTPAALWRRVGTPRRGHEKVKNCNGILEERVRLGHRFHEKSKWQRNGNDDNDDVVDDEGDDDHIDSDDGHDNETREQT